MSKPSYVISCPIDTYSGYGARSRDVAKAIINTDKYDVKILPQRWGDTPGGFLQDHENWKFLNKYIIQKLDSQPDIFSQITIPSEFQKVGKFNIGITAGIESTGCQAEWIDGLNRMDLNFVSSQHSKKVFQDIKFEKRDKRTNQPVGVIKLEKPIEVLFEGVDLNTYFHKDNNDVELDLSSIKESFCYLFVGHWMNGDLGHDRKNVGILIKNFFTAFKGKNISPALILKASTGRNSYLSRDTLLKKIKRIKHEFPHNAKLPNVYILNGNLSDSQMNDLYNHPKVKAMVSFTKGEGYGRPLAEFCLSKKPIICSGWSGPLDFLNPSHTVLIGGELENVHPSAANQWLLKETKWFKINDKTSISALKEVYTKYKPYSVKGKKQGQYIKSNFTFEHMQDFIDKKLDEVLPDFPKEVDLSLPILESPKL
tara:strand:- start:1297 stop:2571 length:1275 start_codon:yes stop_codon:yes gene_type:complete